MLISPPFLPLHSGSEANFLNAAFVDSKLGRYPIGKYFQWHGGSHLRAPVVNKKWASVRAVASGEVIFACEPAIKKNPAPGQNYNAFASEPAWTDNGLVILKHKAEIGQAEGQATAFVFYSVYMHLKELATITTPKAGGKKGETESRPLQTGDKLNRKALLGEAGEVYGQGPVIHFEIVLNEAELSILLGTRPRGWQEPYKEPTADGRIDAVFGSLYFYLPGTAPAQDKAPDSHLQITADKIAVDKSASGKTLKTSCWLRMTYQQGRCIFQCLDQFGEPIGNALEDQTHTGSLEVEYQLYSEANRRHKSMPEEAIALSSPSGWYELLRFGRNLGRGPNDKDLLPKNAAHWRRVPTRGGVKWVDLNAPGSFKFSEADFLAIAGWQVLNDDKTPNDQRCDSAHLRGLLLEASGLTDEIGEWLRDTMGNYLGSPGEWVMKHYQQNVSGKPITTSKALAKFSDLIEGIRKDPKVEARLEKLICKFPSELNQQDTEARYGWYFKLPAYQEKPEALGALKAHIKSLTFPRLPEEFKKADYRFHPKSFITLMRQCGWLSKEELAHVYPETPEATRETYRLALNQVTRKYFFHSNASRMSHFFGQGAWESGWLLAMVEGGNTKNSKAPENSDHWFGELETDPNDSHFTSYDWRAALGNLGSPDGKKFRGRGFKQLTGRANYSKYWLYRGWLAQSSFDVYWWDDDGYKARKPEKMKKVPAQIDAPQLISTSPYNCIDAGGFYMTFMRPNVLNKMNDVNDASITSVTKAINGLTNGLPERKKATRDVEKVFDDLEKQGG